jgi:hypothetical protein
VATCIALPPVVYGSFSGTMSGIIFCSLCPRGILLFFHCVPLLVGGHEEEVCVLGCCCGSRYLLGRVTRVMIAVCVVIMPTLDATLKQSVCSPASATPYFFVRRFWGLVTIATFESSRSERAQRGQRIPNGTSRSSALTLLFHSAYHCRI